MGERLTLGAISPEIEPTLVCKCSEVIVKSRGVDEVVRAKVVIIKDNRVFAICKGCSAEVELPLTKSLELPVEKPAESGPRLYLKQ